MLRRSLLLAALAAASSFPLIACTAGGEPGAEEGETFDLEEGPALAFDSYDVLFTNPTCKTYPYGPEQDVRSVGGAKLTEKPKDVYCTADDIAASAARPTSPEHKLIEWIRDPATTEIFFAYLSYSNRPVTAELCKAIQERNVKVTFVLDSGTDLKRAEELLACKPGNGDPALAPRMELRGHVGSLGYFHDKLFAFNPNGERPRFVFSSGNLSSGTVMHHENWHFLQVPQETHFAQAHRCLIDGVLSHGGSKTEFRNFIRDCRRAIQAPEERDIKSFFVPGEGTNARNQIVAGVRSATQIDIAAHRFLYRDLTDAVRQRLSAGGATRLVVDDDIWWARGGEKIGPNEPREYYTVRDLAKIGLQHRYMETNDGFGYLHHNKFINFTMPDGNDAVFCGAGNFTGTAFNDNFENFYYVQIPHVVQAMKAQYTHLFEDLATAPNDMPNERVKPTGAAVAAPAESVDPGQEG